MADRDNAAYREDELEHPTGSEETPVYRKVAHDDGWATQLWFIVCHEGWRQSIVCERMYEWAADWLIAQIQGRPYASERQRSGPEVPPE